MEILVDNYIINMLFNCGDNVDLSPHLKIGDSVTDKIGKENIQ